MAAACGSCNYHFPVLVRYETSGHDGGGGGGAGVGVGGGDDDGVGGGDDDGDGKSDEGILDTASAKKQIPGGTHHQQNMSKIFLQPWKCTRWYVSDSALQPIPTVWPRNTNWPTARPLLTGSQRTTCNILRARVNYKTPSHISYVATYTPNTKNGKHATDISRPQPTQRVCLFMEDTKRRDCILRFIGVPWFPPAPRFPIEREWACQLSAPCRNTTSNPRSQCCTLTITAYLIGDLTNTRISWAEKIKHTPGIRFVIMASHSYSKNTCKHCFDLFYVDFEFYLPARNLIGFSSRHQTCATTCTYVYVLQPPHLDISSPLRQMQLHIGQKFSSEIPTKSLNCETWVNKQTLRNTSNWARCGFDLILGNMQFRHFKTAFSPQGWYM